MVDIEIERKDICAVIVTFHPDSDFKDRLERVKQQVDKTVIIDNHSNEESLSLLRALCNADTAILIENSANRGVAHALNQGMDYASGQGYKWALLLDQDTIVLPIMVEELMNVYQHYNPKEKIGIIGSKYQDTNSNTTLQDDCIGNEIWCKKDTVITSGSLISIFAFMQAGKFINEFFIDAVDTEYCLRLEEKGFAVLLTKKVLMLHSIGKITMHKIFGRTVGTTNHIPMRQYYMVRNNIAVIRKYRRKNPEWSRKMISSIIKGFILVILFEEKKITKAGLMLKGFAEGLFMKI